MLSDSFTATLEVPREASWTRLLSDRLGLPVLNAGIDGTGTDAHLALEARLARDGRPADALFLIHDAHLNVYGNEVVGEAVADALAPRLH